VQRHRDKRRTTKDHVDAHQQSERPCSRNDPPNVASTQSRGLLLYNWGAILVDTWGQRNSIALVGILSTIMLIIFSQQAGYNNLLIFGYLFAFFHDAGLSAVAPYTPELYPTRARATGVGYANGAGRIASIISPIAVGFLVPMGLTSVFVVLAAGYLFAAIVMLYFGFETKGLVLEKAALE